MQYKKVIDLNNFNLFPHYIYKLSVHSTLHFWSSRPTWVSESITKHSSYGL